MDVILTLAGAGLIALALKDIFETLFHPSGKGVLGKSIARSVWRGTHWLHRRGSESEPMYVGALAYVLVLATWTALLVFGWALIFLPHLPDGYIFTGGLDPSEHDSLADALYISLVNLTSLGYGDISPEGTLLRILGPVETLFGLGLLTASISWLVSIHGALTRREALAHEVHLLREAEQRLDEPLARAEPELLGRMLSSFTTQTITVRRDLVHLPITHYFESAEDRRVRDELRGFLREMIEQAGKEESPVALRLQAEMLEQALDDFEGTLAESV